MYVFVSERDDSEVSREAHQREHAKFCASTYSVCVLGHSALDLHCQLEPARRPYCHYRRSVLASLTCSPRCQLYRSVSTSG